MRYLARSSALFLVASTIVFSRPIRRLAAVVTNDGIFEKALALADIADPVAYGVKFANTLSSDPRICDPVKQLVTALTDGENAGGVNSVGDRAIVGARKLLGLEAQGDDGLITVLTGLLDGSYPQNVKVRTRVHCIASHRTRSRVPGRLRCSRRYAAVPFCCAAG